MRYYYDPIDTIFNDLFDTWTGSGRKYPSVDVYETKDAYIIEAEVAGYDNEKINLSVDKHILTISSEEVKKELKEGTSKIAEEIKLPAFERSFSLPDGTDEEKISADYKNGILLITLPKLEKAIAKRIEVKGQILRSVLFCFLEIYLFRGLLWMQI